MTKIVHLIAGTRPNFMKVAPVLRALGGVDGWRAVLVHTGQHFDADMSDLFFADLGLPEPDHHLGIGGGARTEQIRRIEAAYTPICRVERPDVVLVVGDVNSTLAAARAAKGEGVPIVHLEAGLRSFDPDMPEEVNRIETDAISDLLLTPSADADRNLIDEGVDENKIVRVGNVMIDSLEMMRAKIEARTPWTDFGLEKGAYGVVTLHRPANVDEEAPLQAIVRALAAAAEKVSLVFPVHPRTRQALDRHGLWDALAGATGLHPSQPQGYVDFMALVFGARFALTDSGGIQEETTYLGIPCLTLRANTERPVTIDIGTNRLVDVAGLGGALADVLAGRTGTGRVPDLWDGHTAERVVTCLKARF